MVLATPPCIDKETMLESNLMQNKPHISPIDGLLAVAHDVMNAANCDLFIIKNIDYKYIIQRDNGKFTHLRVLI